MAKDFIDHFATLSSGYAHFRPSYPGELFAWLAEVAPTHQRVWDCATGTGQAARALADHFKTVLATDASASQLAAAEPHPGVQYRLAPAENPGLEAASIDLVTVAQALHWFDRPRFFAEVERVLRPGGVLAVWSYGLATVEDEAVDGLLRHLYHHILGPFWPAERALVENGYQDIELPFAGIPAPSFAMTTAWSLEQLLGYLATWSASARYRAERCSDPLDPIRQPLAAAWGEASARRWIHWPLTVKATRRP
jgi:SAM-dependent methyltransferase